MQLGSPIDAVASSIHHAAHSALPELRYPTRDWAALNAMTDEQQDEARKTNTYPMRDTIRRPEASECTVLAMFPQTWGSTALGFGGIGGAAMTPAYTVLVQGPSQEVAVYWGGRFAYLVRPFEMTPAQRLAWDTDLAGQRTASRREAVAYGVAFENGCQVPR